MKNLVLIGLSGSGKSTLGRIASEQLGRPFIDLDEEIEMESGLPIAEIFVRYGEENFREWESEALKRAARLNGVVLATGGGAVLRAENMACLRETGLLVFLDRPAAQIVKDIKIAHRPLLRDGVEKLLAMDKARRPLYEAAAHVILPNGGVEDEALEKLLVVGQTLALDDYAAIGDPIGHSLSPVLHGAVLAKLGEKAGYAALRVPHGTLPGFVAAARHTGLLGFNVTIPHKQSIMPLLDEVEPGAARCGAVNTVVRRGEKLVGYNTDMEGLHLALVRAGFGYRGRRVLLLGAGGAARAVAFKALAEGAQSLCILARREEAARALAEDVAGDAVVGTDTRPCRGAQRAPTCHSERSEESCLSNTQAAAKILRFAQNDGQFITYSEMTPAALTRAAAQTDVLINATPLGMQGAGADFDGLAFIDALPKESLVCDLIYAPPQTRLLQAAQKRGLAAINGLDMLIYQAILADELYLDRPLEREGLYKEIRAAL